MVRCDATTECVRSSAVSLELLAVATYGAALELPFIANSNPVVKTFAEMTMMQHSEHAAAFNAQATALGGAAQTQPNPKYTPIVEAAKPTLVGAGDVIMLAIALETVATQTYVKNASLLEDSPTKLLMASVSGVEAQHLATPPRGRRPAPLWQARADRDPHRSKAAARRRRQRLVPETVRGHRHGEPTPGRGRAMNTQDQDITAVDADAPGAPSTIPADGVRRGLLFGGMAAAVAAVAAACTSDGESSDTTLGGSTPSESVSTTAAASPSNCGDTASTAAGAGPDSTPTNTRAGGEESEEAPPEEPEGDEGQSSDGKNQEADVPVRENDVDGGRDPNTPTAKEPSAELAQDLAVVEFAAWLEVLAVNTYRRASLAADDGALGPVPLAVEEFIRTVMGHHQAALDELNRTLLLSGEPEMTTPDAELHAVVEEAFPATTDVPGAARLALMLEEPAAATYLAAIPVLKSPEAIAFAASIYPIDMQHASVLHFVLGEYPVPDVFGTVDKAASPI